VIRAGRFFRVAVWFGGGMLAVVSAAQAAEPTPMVPPAVPLVGVRFGAHGTFDRIVLDVPAGVAYRLGEDSANPSIHFVAPVRLPVRHFSPQGRVVGMSRKDQDIRIALCPTCSSTMQVLGRRIVIDVVMDPARARAPQEAGSKEAAASAMSRPSTLPTAARDGSAGPGANAGILPGLPAPFVAVADGPVPPAAHARAVTPAAVSPAAASGPTPPAKQVAAGQAAGPSASGPEAEARPHAVPAAERGDGPLSLAARILPADAGHAAALLLPVGRHVGIAAYQRGDHLVIALTRPLPLDVAGISGDPVFGNTVVKLFPASTLVDVTLPSPVSVSVRRHAEGWVIADAPSEVAQPQVVPILDEDGVHLPAQGAGPVLTIADPETGLDLLVGTVTGPVFHVPERHRAVAYQLDPTVAGVVVERFADDVELRRGTNSFFLPGHVSHGKGWASGGPAPSLSGLAPLNVVELRRRHGADIAQAALLPPDRRRALRLDAAVTALGLGEAREARDIALVADADAPNAADADRSAFVEAASTLLLGGPDAGTQLDRVAEGGSGEARFWRALAAPAAQSAESAAVIAHDAALLDHYPDPLRTELMDRAALLLVRSGTDAQASIIGRWAGGGRTALARALLAEREKQHPAALRQLDALAGDQDPAVSEKAAVEAIRLRVQDGQLDAAHAAAQLERWLLDARMIGDEPALRLQLSELRGKQGDIAGALRELREVATRFPADALQARRNAASLLAQAVSNVAPAHRDGPLPVDRIAIIQANLDLLPPGKAGGEAALGLADRLGSLDLPAQAALLIQKALPGVPAGPSREALEMRLAQLDLDAGQPAAALAALDALQGAQATSPERAAARAQLRARASLAAGRPDAALDALADQHDGESEALRADLLARRQDWPGEEQSLKRLLAAGASKPGPLDDTQQDLVLRLAGAAARAGDEQGLREIALQWKDRVSDPHRQATLQMLTQDRILAVTDLKRSAADLKTARIALEEPAIGGGGS